MSNNIKTKLPLTFDIVVLYELVVGSIETTIGLGLIIFGEELQELYFNFRNTGILDSPHGLIITSVQKYAPFLSAHYLFIGIYLFLVGLTKIICGIGLSQRKRWADYLLVGLLLVFLPLDIVGLLHHPSITRILFVSLNIVIILYLTRDKIVKHILNKH